MSGSSIEIPLARVLEEMLGSEAGSFAWELRERAMTSTNSATAMIRQRLGEDCPIASVNVFAQTDLLRAVVDLSDTAFWMMGIITVRSLLVPQTAMSGLKGGPLRDVIRHRWFDDAMVATDIRGGPTSTIIDVGRGEMPMSQMKGWSSEGRCTDR